MKPKFSDEIIEMDTFGDVKANDPNKFILKYMETSYIKINKIKEINLGMNKRALVLDKKGNRNEYEGKLKLSKHGGWLNKNNYSLWIINHDWITVGFRFSARPNDFGETEGTGFVYFEVDKNNYCNLEYLRNYTCLNDDSNPYRDSYKEVTEKDICNITKLSSASAIDNAISKLNAITISRNKEDVEKLVSIILNKDPLISHIGLRVVMVKFFIELNEGELLKRSANRDAEAINIQNDLDRLYSELGVEAEIRNVKTAKTIDIEKIKADAEVEHVHNSLNRR